MVPMPSPELDPTLLSLLCKKTLSWKRPGRELLLDVPVDVFSSFQVDLGTERLLREIDPGDRKWATALDMGCGYGPVGLHLAAAGLAERVDAIDRDALAVAFTNHNARRNALSQVTAWGGIAYDPVPGAAYDAVVTNLPAKAGRSVHELILLGARRHLRPGGMVWLVAVEPLEAAVDEILGAEGVDVRRKVRRKGHVVYSYSFCGEPALPDAPYVRAKASFHWGALEYPMTCLHGLGEFDHRSWLSDLMVDLFHRRFRDQPIRRLMVCNPGQGHVAVLASRIAGEIEAILAVSRDLLGLKATQANLRDNGYQGALRGVHAADFACGCGDAGPDVVLATLNDKEGIEVNVELLRRLFSAGQGCRAVVGCGAGFASRLRDRLKRHGIRASARKKRKGFCASVLE